MKRESFPKHFISHWIAYLALASACLLIGITTFQLTLPRSDEPRTLLIDAGGTLPNTTYHARVEYPSEDADPEIVQAYVLTTGSGDFDYYIAPAAILQELYDQGLLLPIGLHEAISVADGTPVGSPLNGEYCLCLAHTADEQAIQALSPVETQTSE